MSDGTLDTLLVHPREIFRDAIAHNAAASSSPTTTPAATPEDIAGLLRRYGLEKRDVVQISTFGCGNVRQAMLDAETALRASRLAA